MPKTHSEYNKQIKYRTSSKWMLLLENGRRSKAAREGFGVGTIPTIAQFYRIVLTFARHAAIRAFSVAPTLNLGNYIVVPFNLHFD